MDKIFNLTVLVNDEDNIWQIFKTDSHDDPLAHGNMINGSVHIIHSDLMLSLVLRLLYSAKRGDFGSGNTESDIVELMKVEIDPNHQKDHCDRCKITFQQGDEEILETCSISEHLLLCRNCYDAAGNNVR